jgi:hypothetical protein
MAITANATTLTFNDATTQTTAFGAPGFQEYTSGSGSFTVPAGITQIRVKITAGGGSGGTPSAGCGLTGFAGGGGGGGGSGDALIAVTPAAVISYTVGTGGAAPAAVNTTGAAGTSSSFGSFITCTGGAGGLRQQGTSDAAGMNGLGGAAGTVTYSGTTYVLAPFTGAGGNGDFYNLNPGFVYWTGGDSGSYNINGYGAPRSSVTGVAFDGLVNRIGTTGSSPGFGGQGGYCYNAHNATTSRSGAGANGIIQIFW